MDNEKCEYLFVHEDTVKKVINDMPEEEKLYDLAELFKIFGDSTRIKILYALFEAELCVWRPSAAFEGESDGGFSSAKGFEDK